jgi:hypothetical protein
MTPTSKPPDPDRMPAAMVGTKFAVIGGEVGCLTLIIVLLAVFGGLWLDGLFGTKPVITLILVLASAPLSLALTFWLAKRAIGDATRPPAVGKNPSATEGDDSGE